MNQTLSKTQTVQCGWMPNVLLNEIRHCRFNNETAVHCIRISEFSNKLDKLKSFLSDSELLKSENYLMEKDTRRFIVSRAMLKLLLGKYIHKDPRDVRFYFESNLKPRLKHSGNDIHFNVSHSGDMVAIAIGPEAVGVDIEYLDEDFRYDTVLEKVFNEKELKFIHNSNNPSEAFFLLWTRKEALLKATGRGIDDQLTLTPSLNGPHSVSEGLIGSDCSWQVGSFGLGNDYIASLAIKSTQASDYFRIYRTGTEIL